MTDLVLSPTDFCPFAPERPHGPDKWHNWRLFSRDKVPLFGTFGEVTQENWEETWYCTRCRLVDRRAGGPA